MDNNDRAELFIVDIGEKAKKGDMLMLKAEKIIIGKWKLENRFPELPYDDLVWKEAHFFTNDEAENK